MAFPVVVQRVKQRDREAVLAEILKTQTLEAIGL